MNYILIYNGNTGKTEQIIPEADHTKAYNMFEAKDQEYADNQDIEVNYVTADSDVDLRKTWRRFFLFQSLP